MKWILLDTGPLGVISNPRSSERKTAIEAKIIEWESAGYAIAIPEIADFEVRRELLRSGKMAGVANLDDLGREHLYLSLTTSTMRLAARLWAQARQQGQPTAGPFELDGDVILGAQARIVQNIGAEVVVATFNTRHLSRYTSALQPQDIV